ncbi:tetratricopeptide repeat protein [Kutzneria buriramensis]|uniref:Tetratricopeptide repeat protein n=1 Tax=Kutzneria buriramensis TaxID=1045776 RepID=A0A3E0HBA5_9PSEU|nr:tetratricopeptide repeat protein [Kutzneria buriramensis]REH41702.1 tetratricopeptide repeat protein [Kutzneria buriramensis]
MEWTLRLLSRPRRSRIIVLRRRAAINLELTEPRLALTRLRELAGLSGRLLGDNAPATLDVGLSLAACQHLLGQYADAIETLDATIPRYDMPRHRNAQVLARAWRASSMSSLGQHDAAVSELRAVVDEARAAFGDHTNVTLLCRSKLASALDDAGQFTEAVEQMASVLAARTRILGPDHTLTLCARHAFGLCLLGAGEFDRAEEEFVTVLAAPDGHASCALVCKRGLAKVAVSRGRNDEATRLYEEVIERWTAYFGADHAAVREARDELAAIAD